MSELRYALLLGCTIQVRGFNYELSVRKVAEKLGIEFVDILDFACCGFPLAGVHNHSAMAIAARNLALAESKGLDIVTLCSACTGHMTHVQKRLSNPKNWKELERINEDLKDFGLELKGTTKVKHFARMLYEDVGLTRLEEAVTHPLKGLKIAPHYGCHYIKPSGIFDGFDDPIRPQSLDRLIEITGAEAVQYRDKLQCCGGGILAMGEDTPLKMVKQKLDHIKKVKGDAITLLCPFCDIMLDEYQPTIETKFETDYNIPVLYYPQLLGLAMGLHPRKDLAVNKNQVKVRPLLKKIESSREGGE